MSTPFGMQDGRMSNGGYPFGHSPSGHTAVSDDVDVVRCIVAAVSFGYIEI